MDRRQFLHQTALLPSAAYAVSSSAAASPDGQAGGSEVSLREKFFGCIAGAHVGSALKGPCEGWDWQDIQAKYGTIDHLIGYQDYNNGWNREPGTTEDGVERQKMMITAIIEKKDRVTAEDVRAIWVRDMKPEAAGMISEAFEGVLLAMAKTGIPACDIGRYCDYAGLNSMARACHPIPLINAGDTEGAVADVFEVGQLYQTTNSRGLQWAAVTGIAIASATKPGATVDSVIADILKGTPRWRRQGSTRGRMAVASEIERGLEHTKTCKDFREMRVAFDKVYGGRGMPYYASYANEVVTKAVCVFQMCKGNPKDAMIAGVNMGRDTDCLAAMAAGYSGALSGASAIPAEWIKQVDYATTKMPVTNSRRTIREHADGLYDAFLSRLRKMRAYTDQMEKA
jgi:ADP-ribosylglycohydrolase